MDKGDVLQDFILVIVILGAGGLMFIIFSGIQYQYDLCEAMAEEKGAIDFDTTRDGCKLTFCDEEEVTVNNKTFVDNCREEVWRLKE